MDTSVMTLQLQVTPDFLSTLDSIAKSFRFESREKALVHAARVLFMASKGLEFGGALKIVFPDGTASAVLKPEQNSKSGFMPRIIQGGKSEAFIR